MPELTVTDLAARLKGPAPPVLIDVREPDEFAYCRIDGAQLRPLGAVMRWARDLDPEAEVVVYCHVGIRSYEAVRFLRDLGFARVLNLSGGIDAWSRLVDPSVPRY